MKGRSRVVAICCLLCVTTMAIAQDEAVFDTTALKQQFDYVIQKSNTFEQFKVVRMRHLTILKKNTADTLAANQRTISTNVAEIEQLKTTQQTMTEEMTELKAQLEKVTNSKNSLSFFGQEISKSVYNTMMWGLVLGLAALSGLLFTLFKRGHQVTKETKQRLTELEEEFENHRKTALRREQKLARELMDEKIKNQG